jgi:hypothetical protein
MNPGRGDKESGAFGKRRAEEATSTSSEASLMAKKNPGLSNREAGASSKKQAEEASTPSEAEKSKKAKIPQYIYILLYEEGGLHSVATKEIIGVYSSETLAKQNAKMAIDGRSNGFYINGKFKKPSVSVATNDYTGSGSDEDDEDDEGEGCCLFFQSDRKGEFNKISLLKKGLDELIHLH